MCELSLLFGHKLLKFEIHVVMHLSQRRLQTRCQNTNSSSQMRWLLKGMGDGTLNGLVRVTPKTHLRVSAQPILDLQRAIYPRHISNIAIEPSTKLLLLFAKTHAFESN